MPGFQAFQNSGFQSFVASGFQGRGPALTTRMYLVDRWSDAIHEYSMSTPWDVSTASAVQSISVGTRDAIPSGIFFKSDGLKMYWTGFQNSIIYEYDLSTAWDISTASFLQGFDVRDQGIAPADVAFSDDGSRMFIADEQNDFVHGYTLGTAWDISTASAAGSVDVGGQTSAVGGFGFGDGGRKMYVASFIDEKIIQYNLSTPWDVSTASFTQEKAISAGDSDTFDVHFRPNGLVMYVLIADNDLGTPREVRQFDLSTAWDISTATLSTSYSIAGGILYPFGMFIAEV